MGCKLLKRGRGARVMQKLTLKVKMWQTLLSMFLASMAALLISAMPAYADDDVSADGAPAQPAPIVQVLDEEPGAEVAAVGAPAPEALESVAVDGNKEAVAPATESAPGEALAASSQEQSALTSIYNITESGSYTLTGVGVTPISIAGDIDVTLDLINASIDATNTGHSAISIVDRARVVLNVVGECVMVGDANHAGIQVESGSSLVVNGTENPSSLKAIGNAGVTNYANDKDSGAGIGGQKGAVDCGTITVNGNGRNLTLSAEGGGHRTAGIGSGNSGLSGAITISETILQGIHGGCYGAPIAGNVEDSKKTLEGGPAIGSTSMVDAHSPIVINGCYGADIVGGGKSAGIGGGYWTKAATISIVDSDLEVEGGVTGAAIGVGRCTVGTAVTIDISNSAIKAWGGYLGAAIGLGFNENKQVGESSVAIHGGTIVATGGTGAAAIGGGAHAYNVSVTIDEGASVVAYAGANYAAKYTELYNGTGDLVLENGGEGIGQSGAAAIGRGAWGSVGPEGSTFLIEPYETAKLTISADSFVIAMSSGDNWAIGGFTDQEGVEASILQTRFVRNYDLHPKGDPTWQHFITRDKDIEAGWAVCFLDGAQSTDLIIKSADTLQPLFTLATPELGESFAHDYDGPGRVGYYSFAISVPGAGAYKISTDSAVRTVADDALVSLDDEGYMGGATYWGDSGRTGIFNVEGAGISSFDRVAFRTAADPIPEPPAPVTPDEPIAPDDPDTPEEPVTPDEPDTPVTPDEPDTPDTPVVPVEPIAPAGPADPVAPEPPAPTPTPAPAPTPAPTPAVAPAAEVIPDADTPLAPGADAPQAEAIPDADTPLAQSEAIADDETPLAGIFDEGEECWVHWWILLGIVVTGVYGSIVLARRKKHSHDVFNIDKGVMNDEDYGQERVNVPSANLGAQPTMSANLEA